MKISNTFKSIIGILAIILIGVFMTSCKSKKKCPDFTQVDGRVKLDKNGLVKKKKTKAPRSIQNF
jgi:glucose uptake protein GlcU